MNEKGELENLLTRDIKNLVGRAGRAGATTKGLVICANQNQWPLVERVARQSLGENVTGTLRRFLNGLKNVLAIKNIKINNALLERSPALHTFIDGVDAILIDLAVEEIGEDNFIQLAIAISDHTFAARQVDLTSKKLLKEVFKLRAKRIFNLHSVNRLEWIRETGTHIRLLDKVEIGLLPRVADWEHVIDPISPNVVDALLGWSWEQPELQLAVREAYRVPKDIDINTKRTTFFNTVNMWLAGKRFWEMAEQAELTVDRMLGVYSKAITFTLQTIVEQGIALLSKLLESQGIAMSSAVSHFPDHLRFGVPTTIAKILMSGGLRHRNAAVQIAAAMIRSGLVYDDRDRIFQTARRSLLAHRDGWVNGLGPFVFENTLQDLSIVTGDNEAGA